MRQISIREIVQTVFQDIIKKVSHKVAGEAIKPGKKLLSFSTLINIELPSHLFCIFHYHTSKKLNNTLRLSAPKMCIKLWKRLWKTTPMLLTLVYVDEMCVLVVLFLVFSRLFQH